MPGKEKVMTVTLMRSDLYESPSYLGASLQLPASRDEIQYTIDQARIRNGQEYQIVECFNIQGEELSFISETFSLAELNFLAWRISNMNEHDRIAFTGCVIRGEGNLRMRELQNSGELPKFKAAFEIAGCMDIDQVLDLARNLDCYDFYPELTFMEDYIKQDFINRYRIPADDPTLQLIHFSRADPNQMQDINICRTPYGIIQRNDREMTPDIPIHGLASKCCNHNKIKNEKVLSLQKRQRLFCFSEKGAES
ncbi:hypothetical protein DesLBE_3919 [Desulfitobacterium sp. LBE]|uniref:Uncharacterized protein n=1 Tax=bioreactor metagenome TaxID=1076179 RepID=A0A644UB40_9ZZZZ|nr:MULTISPECIES: antirestriction protein ArdA [Desulfitobacterium]MEA5022203.1 hypothetical protein [Desulfitobacterium hafniense]TWH59534.1 hypothetical protein DesLBE_3919 [Desulfitobacterium sp. LBE]